MFCSGFGLGLYSSVNAVQTDNLLKCTPMTSAMRINCGCDYFYATSKIYRTLCTLPAVSGFASSAGIVSLEARAKVRTREGYVQGQTCVQGYLREEPYK